MLRFNRTFNFTVTDNKGSFTINSITGQQDLKITFEILKSMYGSLNNMNMQIYNLNEEHGNRMIKDAEEVKQITLNLQIGYGDQLESAFIGTIFRGYRSKEGTNMINYVQSLDGGFGYIHGFVSKTVKTKKEALETLVDAMPGVTLGKIAPQKELIRPKVMVGNAGRVLQNFMDPTQTWVIDNGKLNIVGDADYLGGYMPVVSAQTGLLNTPSRENKRVSFTTMYNPGIRIGNIIKLESLTAKYLNGIYRIDQLILRGDNKGQEWTQTCYGMLAEGFNKL